MSLRRGLRLIFRDQIKLDWRGGPRVALVDGVPERSPDDATQRAMLEQQAMLDELQGVLDEIDDLRAEVPHLAQFEQALLEHGPQALAVVSLPVLTKALEEFEGLVSNWSGFGLATLRSRMAVEVRSRSAAVAGSLSGLPSAVRAASGRAGGTSTGWSSVLNSGLAAGRSSRSGR